MRYSRLLAVMGLLLVFLLSACGGDDLADAATTTTTSAEAVDDTPTAGPVTIVSQDDSSTRPVTGTFEVTEGADVLGCSSGTFVDEFIAQGDIMRVHACDSGSNEGAFTFSFDLAGTATGEGDDGGAWSVEEGSDDFLGLEGSGDWFVDWAIADPDIGVSTWTGDIEYTP